MAAANGPGRGDANRAYIQSDSQGGRTGGQSLMSNDVISLTLRSVQPVSPQLCRDAKGDDPAEGKRYRAGT